MFTYCISYPSTLFPLSIFSIVILIPVKERNIWDGSTVVTGTAHTSKVLYLEM